MSQIIYGQQITEVYTDDINYLGFTFSSDQKDGKDLLRQLRLLYTKSNRLLRIFYDSSTDVKIALFRSYCTCFYCPFSVAYPGFYFEGGGG